MWDFKKKNISEEANTTTKWASEVVNHRNYQKRRKKDFQWHCLSLKMTIQRTILWATCQVCYLVNFLMYPHQWYRNYLLPTDGIVLSVQAFEHYVRHQSYDWIILCLKSKIYYSSGEDEDWEAFREKVTSLLSIKDQAATLTGLTYRHGKRLCVLRESTFSTFTTYLRMVAKTGINFFHTTTF